MLIIEGWGCDLVLIIEGGLSEFIMHVRSELITMKLTSI